MTATLLKFPEQDIKDIPRTLRALADDIEQGEFGDAHNLAWVIDCGDSRIELGLAGAASSPGAEAHLLFSIAQRRLEEPCYTSSSP